MAENFARHRSTRWVKSKSQNYDSWGDSYDDYPYDEAEGLEVMAEEPETPESSHIQEPHHSATSNDQAKTASPVSAPPLVLSIDRLKSRASDDSLDEESDHFNVDNNVTATAATGTSLGRIAPPEKSSDLELERPLALASESRVPPHNLAPLSTSGLKDDADFFPPTPTFTVKQFVQPQTPDTPYSDRSFVSDADSIQREPDTLNLAYGELNKIREELPAHDEADKQAPEDAVSPSRPDELVLTIDRMNLNLSDDSSLDEVRYNRHSFRLESTHGSTDDFGDIVDTEHAKARIVDSSGDEMAEEEDDWGYNSQHSSNDEDEHVEELRPAERITSGESASRHVVDTDALDSLINDLLKMERLSTMYLEKPGKEPSTLAGKAKESQPGTIRDVKGSQDDFADSSADQSGYVPEELPSLSSIHDISMPDFENHGSELVAGAAPSGDILPEAFQRQHETFLSNVLSRAPSVRKAPQTTVNAAGSLIPTAENDVALLASYPDGGLKLEPVNSTGSISTGNASFDVASSHFTPQAPPSVADPDTMSRRVSTVSTQTFNMGSWKPNTNKFREEFVNQNDAESQMDVSIYGKDDSNYNRFTGLQPPSGYAESLANSDMISVPETIDAPLPSIIENNTDGDDVIEERTTSSINNSQPEITTVNTNTASVFKDHPYDKPVFEEERSTPAASSDYLPGEDKSSNETRAVSGGSNDTLSRKVSDLTTTTLTTAKPPSQKYPVFNWKQIMSISQPVDRIEKLKKAQQDELNYETGLSYWLGETLKSSEQSPHIQIGAIATQAYQNAQHSDLRRHTSIRSKVSLVKDKMETGNFGLQASSFGRKFLSRGKKLMKSGTD